ncbi:MAG: repeat containing protein, partial [Flavipsychrobacter sp.]|nr:repeat containing protein [Flavipsychrobacter sp.]
MKKSRLFGLLMFLNLIIGGARNINAQIISTFAGTGAATSTGDGGPATAATFNNPSCAYFDKSGNLYVIEYSGAKIRKITPGGIVSTYAGSGIAGYGGDGGPATSAKLNDPIDMYIDGAGNTYIIDNNNQRIRKLDASGIMSTYAGNGVPGYTGDGGPASAAQVHDPSRLTTDVAGNMFFCDAGNNVIRKITPGGIITTVAGNGFGGFGGDGGPATAANFYAPIGVGFDGLGNMYIADAANHRIRKINTLGIVSTIAGNGTASTTGDGGPSTASTVDYPNGLAVDANCNVYFTDWNGQRVRKITPAGIISTVVATGVAGFSGDGGLATAAQINGPNNLTFDGSLNLYLPEYHNNRVRKIINLGETGLCFSVSPKASFGSSVATTCQDSCITFTSTSTGLIDSVQWSVAPSSAYIGAAKSGITDICFSVPGPVTVKIKAYGSGTVDSTTSTIIISPKPMPTISLSGSTLTATGGPYTSYQWYIGSTMLPGATNVTYTYSLTASYSVMV